MRLDHRYNKYCASLLTFIFATALFSPQDCLAQKKKFVRQSEATQSQKKSGLGENANSTASGLQYIDIVEGKGDTPKVGQVVSVDYTMWLHPSGEKVESTKERGFDRKIVVGMDGTLPGLDECLKSMKAGGKRTILLPPELAYGSRGRGNMVPPNSAIKMEVEVLQLFPMRQAP